jgi:acyl dehydratase
MGQSTLAMASKGAEMSKTPIRPRGLYFEEFEPGMTIITPGRTITESDIVSFAGLTGDFNLIHTDAVYSATSPFGQRVAHGLLGLSIAVGLGTRTGVLEGTVLAFREINEWKFVKPVFIGDTIHVVMEVTETRAMPRIGGGAVVLKLDVQNQKDEVVMKGKWTVLMMSKPSEEG